MQSLSTFCNVEHAASLHNNKHAMLRLLLLLIHHHCHHLGLTVVISTANVMVALLSLPVPP